MAVLGDGGSEVSWGPHGVVVEMESVWHERCHHMRPEGDVPIWEQPDDVRVAVAQARVAREILSRFSHLREAQ